MSPKDRVMGPLPNGRTLWLINGGDPNHLLTWTILQIEFLNRIKGIWGIMPLLNHHFGCLLGGLVTIIAQALFKQVHTAEGE